jgi:hypothetical protein
LKAFAYVNATNEKEAVAALGTESALARRILPMAGGMDLLGLMKDYIVSPIASSASGISIRPLRRRPSRGCVLVRRSS